MPEIAEVAVQVDGLQEVVGKVIKNVTLYDAEPILNNCTPALFKSFIDGAQIMEVTRKGKYVIFELYKKSTVPGESNWLYMVTHFTMTGGYAIDDGDYNILVNHCRIMFELDKGTLYYKDIRKWSNIYIMNGIKLMEMFEHLDLGADALMESSYSLETDLLKLFHEKNRDKPLKELLLDQTIIAGLGNIYTCEVLHEAGIHPETTPSQIETNELQEIAIAINEIVTEAYQCGGSSIKDYTNVHGKKGTYQNHHKVYGRKGKYCATCIMNDRHTLIESIKIKGRSTFFCPTCQPERGE